MSSSVVTKLKIKDKLISFPYINHQKPAYPVNQLLVDITVLTPKNNTTPSQASAKSLKYVFCRYFPTYKKYLQNNIFNANKTLQQEISNYYDSIIYRKIEYKYSVGQFGYILNEKYTLEESFVQIIETTKMKKELWFLHSKLNQYKYQLYDITSKNPKTKIVKNGVIASTGWINEYWFSPVVGTFCTAKENTNQFAIYQLLNWKICREDFLQKKIKLCTTPKNIVTDQIDTDSVLDEETSCFPQTSQSEGSTD